MERWACVDVPALPLQVLMLRHRDWVGAPVAVVDADKPQGTILWVNSAARRQRIRPGMRYATALSLEPSLRAGAVDEATSEAAVERLVARLRSFSPEIEPSAAEPGVFWLDASGFEGVFPSLDEWARRVVESLRGVGLTASVTVGFERFGTYALARLGRGAQVLASVAEERDLSGRVSLDLLRIDAKLRGALDRLGVTTVAGLRGLPEGGLLERFGAVGHALQRFVNGAVGDRVDGVVQREPIVERLELEPGDTPLDTTALLFLLKSRLAEVCARLARRGEATVELQLRVLLDDAPTCEECIRPAEPTLDELQLIDLVRLRLERVEFSAPVTGFELSAEGVRATRKQLELFAEKSLRDLAAANRALARLRAEFGDESVLRARLREGHLPEGAFCWHALDRLERAEPIPRERAPLVRRVLAVPQKLDRDRREPDGWCAAGLACGPVRRTFGPYIVSGRWWRQELWRGYHFAETGRGDVLWVYYDRRSRRWFLHGWVD